MKEQTKPKKTQKKPIKVEAKQKKHYEVILKETFTKDKLGKQIAYTDGKYTFVVKDRFTTKSKYLEFVKQLNK